MNELGLLQKFLCVVLAFVIFIAGCGGQAANPVERYAPGDEKRSCNALYAEMSQLDQETTRKNQQKKNRDTWNAIFFASGFVLLVPWFFMDLKGSPEIEIDALKARKRALTVLYSDKNCTPPSVK